MYHAIVRAQLRRAFASINRGDYDPVIASFHAGLRHVFYGHHALGGIRQEMPQTKLWYGRLARVFPDLRFEVRAIAIRGWPWHTIAMVEWVDHFTIDGKPASNQGVHVLCLRWGKVVDLAIYCDTQKLAAFLQRKADAGLPEATAEPIGLPAA